MGVYVVKNPKLYVNATDITGKTKEFNINIECDMVEKTSFDSSGYKEYAPGCLGFTVDYSGYFSASDNDVNESTFDAIGNSCEGYFILAPETGTTGGLAYFGIADQTKYSIGGAVGEIVPFSATLQGTEKISNGTIIFTKTVGGGSSGYGTVYELGGVMAGQQTRSILQAYSFSGAGNFIAIVNASCTSGFASGVTAMTFTTLTNEGSEIIASALPSTDKPFFRVDYASSGGGMNDVKVIVAVDTNF